MRGNGFIDIASQRFGRLIAIEPDGHSNSKDRRVKWRCLCQCGTFCRVSGRDLRNGRTQSCGCLKRDRLSSASKTHGMSKSPTYQSWASMKSRCYNKKQQNYKRYGALGIRVCDRWLSSFESFLADMGERPEGTTLDRRNPVGNYEAGNCRWSTPKAQALNTRGHAAIRFIEKMGLTKEFESGQTST